MNSTKAKAYQYYILIEYIHIYEMNMERSYVVASIMALVLGTWWIARLRSHSSHLAMTTGMYNATPDDDKAILESYSSFPMGLHHMSRRTFDRNDIYVRDPYAYVNETRWVTVAVDSRDRDLSRFPRPDRYEVALSEPLHHVVRARLVSAEIPSTFYVFTQELQNTTLRMRVGTNETTLTIPDGNYGIDDMVRALEYVIQEAFAPLRFQVIADPITHGLGIRSTSDPPISFSIETDDYVAEKVHWGLGYYLGFPRQTVVHSQNGRLEGERPVVLNPETYMMLDVPEFGSVQEMGIQGKSRLSGSKPFAKVPVQVQTFQYSFFDTPMGTSEMHPPLQRLDKINVRWRFHDGTPVNFQDVDHSFTIEVLCTRGRNV